MIDIKKSVKENVKFIYFKDGVFYYATIDGDVFGVPLDDIGTATLLMEDKGILFMRYMKKWNERLKNDS